MKKILIVEDVELNLDLIVQLLEDNYDLVTAQNGEEGVVIAKREKPDLILMDMSLPVMNGWDATRILRLDPQLCKIPIIGLSAHAMSGDDQKALEAGCNAYLTKPLDEDQLFEALGKFIG